MKKVILSLAGECSINRDQLEQYDFVIGVDSGAEYLYKLFLIPNLIFRITKKVYFKYKSHQIREKFV